MRSKKRKKRVTKSRKKENTKIKTWEKVFILLSLSIIFIIMGIYLRRLIYYYQKSNYIAPDSKLVDVITNQMHIVYNGDGLYRDDSNNTYYYNGTNVNNYVSYSGRLWRIISVDDIGIKIVTDNNETSLVWGNNTTYDKSNIYKWLNNDFVNSLYQNENIITSNWCNKGIELNSYNCEEVTEAKVGLITTNEYIGCGGVNCYLNNKDYYWTINTDANNKAYYVHNEGGLNNEVGANGSLYSYGVRPVIYLSKELSYKSGDGKKDNPYIIDKNIEIAINDHPVGTYVEYQGYTWRVLEIYDDYTKLILEGYITDENNEPIKMTYDKVFSYLNSTFIEKFNKEELVETSYNQTEFNINNSYDYASVKNKNNGYFGIPSVGNQFITEYPGAWLNTYFNSNQRLIYTTDKNSSLFADLASSENYVRPVIAIKNGLIISSGEGSKEVPYKIGDVK